MNSKTKVSANSLDKAGNTPLHWAAYGGHVECVNELLKVANIALDIQVNIYIIIRIKTNNLQ